MGVLSTPIVLPVDTRTPAHPALALGLEEACLRAPGDPKFFIKPAGCKKQKVTMLVSAKTKGWHLGAGVTSVNVKQGLSLLATLY